MIGFGLSLTKNICIKLGLFDNATECADWNISTVKWHYNNSTSLLPVINTVAAGLTPDDKIID